MSTLPVAALFPTKVPVSDSRPAVKMLAATATVLSILGVSAIWPTALYLWLLWTTDPLKSIGMFMPLVSLALILRVWQRLHWEIRGTWWGFVLLVLTAASVHLREQAVLVYILSPSWSINLPPHSLIAFSYVSGAVLLFGGVRLYRAALFPILLIWLVNPVPHIFNVFVDLPLQRMSAHVARAFAQALGQPLTPDQMRLMFTPDFGMFIAPGCNGIRGAVTMGIIALLVGYLARFRPSARFLAVVAAVLLGYLFNFVRLCTLVLYYIVALKSTWLQMHAEMADYLIGGALFLFATWLLFRAVRIFRAPLPPVDPEASSFTGAKRSIVRASDRASSLVGRSVALRFGAMALLIIFGGSRLVHGLAQARTVRAVYPDEKLLGRFPQQIGSYTLVRSWNESLPAGALIYHWAEYAASGDGTHVAIGVSPVLGAHDTLVCHSARGEDPLWHEQLNLATAGNVSTGFSASFFNDGATQYIEASTLCQGATCGEYAPADNRRGFVYSKPDPVGLLLSLDDPRPIPILLRVETIDTSLAPDRARAQLLETLRSFLASVRLDSLTEPYRHR